jgi:LAO/AO transport system kinase
MSALLPGILQADRVALGRALTLIESYNKADRHLASDLLKAVQAYAGGAKRIGIAGIPGVGKSTLIEALGMHLINKGLKVAVLAVDPSSRITGGSILGDKTRMPKLARHPNAFIRPSSTRGTLGGVTLATGEAIVVCEAAGFDVVLVETVGVGQSEIAIADLVDLLVLMVLPGAGDDLQGIKRGLVEFADIFCINKMDSNALLARQAQADLRVALRILQTSADVVMCSALRNEGIEVLWETLEKYWDTMQRSGELQNKRSAQSERNFEHYFEALILMAVKSVDKSFQGQELSPRLRAEQLVERLFPHLQDQ